MSEVLVLTWKVFTEYESPVYPPQGTEGFRKCLHDDAYLSGIEYYGAFDGTKLVGEIGIHNSLCRICFFFVDGAYQRRKLGTKLFNTMKADYSERTITLNSSPYGLPFYKSLGFTPSSEEQLVNGIRFTPMILKNDKTRTAIVKLTERRDLKEKAAKWYNAKWHIPMQVYLESIEESFSATVPSWYLYMEDDKIIAGMGVIANDFHPRKNLTLNVCAVYTEEYYRRQGIAGKLLNYVCEDMHAHGIDTLYLVTDHIGFYERYGWELFCLVLGDGEDKLSRMYVHRYLKS